jgi:predicted CXXCH cytochrome family protein
VVDAGGAFSKSPTVPDATRRQAELKAELQVMSLVADGLHAFVPGKDDLALGTAFLRRMIDEHKLPVLAANLTCDGQTFDGTRVVVAGGRKIGLIGLAGPGLRVCAVSDPAAALTESLAALGPVDVTVLVVNAERADLAALLAGAEGVDFVVAGGSGQTLLNPKRHEAGAWQVGAGSRGKKLGVLALDWQRDATGWAGQGEVEALATRLDRYRSRVDDMAERAASAGDDAARRRAQVQRSHYQEEVTRLEAELAVAVAAAEGGAAHQYVNDLVELDSTIPDHPRVSRWLAETKAAVNAVATGAEPEAQAYSGPFVGSGRCSTCHLDEYRQWQGTGHAKAWPTLVNAQRHGDPDCVSCHAVGHGLEQGPSGVPVPVALRGVGCEDCHGPGQDHVSDPTSADMIAAPEPAACVRCHDGERDEGRFELETYWPRIQHGGG